MSFKRLSGKSSSFSSKISSESLSSFEFENIIIAKEINKNITLNLMERKTIKNVNFEDNIFVNFEADENVEYFNV